MAGEEGLPIADERVPPAPGGQRRQRSSPVLGILGVLGIAGLLVAVVLSGIRDARTAAAVAEGELAPDFRMERFEGGTVSLGELRGKVVMLDFWATWCPPCVKEMPYLIKLAQEYEGQGLAFLAASRDDPADARALVGSFIARRAPQLGPYATFADDGVARSYGVQALPTLFFIDREGRILESHRGALSERQLRDRLARIFAPAP
jgi:thiol-disulfide isomerase/thioredoxin